MDYLQRLEALANAGYAFDIRTTKVVRAGQDVTLVFVTIEGDFGGEGVTLADAFAGACVKYRARIEKRTAKDAALLNILVPTA